MGLGSIGKIVSGAVKTVSGMAGGASGGGSGGSVAKKAMTKAQGGGAYPSRRARASERMKGAGKKRRSFTKK